MNFGYMDMASFSGQRGRTSNPYSMRACASPAWQRMAAAMAIMAPLSMQNLSSVANNCNEKEKQLIFKKFKLQNEMKSPSLLFLRTSDPSFLGDVNCLEKVKHSNVELNFENRRTYILHHRR